MGNQLLCVSLMRLRKGMPLTDTVWSLLTFLNFDQFFEDILKRLRNVH